MALTVFTLASVAGGFAPNGPVLIVARIVQGVGAAIAAPCALSQRQDQRGGGGGPLSDPGRPGRLGRGIPQAGAVRGDVGGDAGQGRVRGQRRQPPSVPQPDRDLAGAGLPLADDRLVRDQP
jgi:hypothetical protein